MKKKLLTFAWMIFAVSAFAQNYAYVSGHVTNTANGNPVPYQLVTLTVAPNYSSTPAGLYFQSDLYADANGYYSDSIPLIDFNNSIIYTQGTLLVYTQDCNSINHYDTVSFSSGIYNLNADFNICSCSIVSLNAVPDNSNDLLINFSTSVNDSIVSWSWDFGDNSTVSNLPTPSHTYTVAAQYYVCLTYTTSFGCTNTFCTTETVGTVPTLIDDPGCDADFYINQTGASSFSLNETSFANTGGADVIVSWSWNFGDGNSSNVQYPSHTYSAPGTYHIGLTIYTAEGCSSSLDMPVIAGTTTQDGCHSDFEMVFNTSLPFSYDLQEASMQEDPYQVITSYFWDFGDGNTSIAVSPSHTFSLPGVYQISHTITTAAGCVSTYTENLVVDSACYMYLIASSIINETSAGSANGAINLTVVGTAPFTFNWSNGAQTQNISGLTAGYNNVWVTDANGCQTWGTFDILTQSDSSNWNYNDTLSTNPVDTCFNFVPASANIYSYAFSGTDTVSITWAVFDSTGSLHGFVTTTYLFDSTSNGYYTVLLEINCDSTRSIHSSIDFLGHIHISGLAAGINTLSAAGNNVMVYPNPVSDKLNISFSLPKSDKVKIDILNALGQVIQTENTSNDGGMKVVTVNTSSLNKGLYFVKLSVNGQIITRRFVK